MRATEKTVAFVIDTQVRDVMREVNQTLIKGFEELYSGLNQFRLGTFTSPIYTINFDPVRRAGQPLPPTVTALESESPPP